MKQFLIRILTGLKNLIVSLIRKLETPIIKDDSDPGIGEVWNVKGKPFLIIARSGRREFTGYMLTAGTDEVTVEENPTRIRHYNKARIHTYSRFLLVEKIGKISKGERKRVVDLAARYIMSLPLHAKLEAPPIPQERAEDIDFEIEIDMGALGNEIKRRVTEQH